MSDEPTPQEIADAKKRQRRIDLGAFILVGLMGVIGCAVAIAFLFNNVDPRGVAVIAAIYMFTSGAAKLVALASDLSDKTKDMLNLVAQTLTLFGGSTGLVAIVSAVSS